MSQIVLQSNAVFNPHITCTKRVPDVVDGVSSIDDEDWTWFDKDGFELSVAEQKFYREMGFPLTSCLYNNAYHVPWFKDVGMVDGIRVDHSVLIHRANFKDDALAQILENPVPVAQWLAVANRKWGLDLAIDHHMPEQPPIEVLHIEVDSYDFRDIVSLQKELEAWVAKQDWLVHAEMVRRMEDTWRPLEGYAQNDWKAKRILGWDKAEYTLKAA